MKAEIIKLLTAKSMSLEPSSKNHDAVLPEDIAHYLGTRGLSGVEYNLLVAKYADNSKARSLISQELYYQTYNNFINLLKDKKLQHKTTIGHQRTLIQKFINLAMREVIENACPICNGKGFIANLSQITKCVHCDNSGNFIYDDNNRREMIGLTRKNYSIYKDFYHNLLEKLQNIEISALSKIGDT
tara:strand:+ start:493 stop:1050 length:558 start_codon:yes stop_codon:yes gene_type:complete